MSYKEDFERATGWSAVDVAVRLNNTAGKRFLAWLRSQGVDTIIRYYASSARPKTITPEEAILLSSEGFAILPVYQDNNRKIENFSAQIGKESAQHAIDFAKRVGQPEGKGSTILFAVDADFTAGEIDGPISDYFEAIRKAIGQRFRIGAYGSGALLSKLAAEKLTDLSWISMSRAFLGTQQFFYANKWALRQVPPEMEEAESKIGYDRNIIRVDKRELGAFQVDANGRGALAWSGDMDPTLGGDALSWTATFTEAQKPDLYVTTEGTRLREAPNGTIRRSLTLAEPVTSLGEPDAAGWRKISASGEVGYAADAYLREPLRPEVEALLARTVAEWVRFEKGKANEEADPYYKFVREMWAAIGEPWDGRSRDSDGKPVAWSAAFISWVVRRAGPAYANFKFAAAHSVFVNNAIKARVTGRTDKPFWGYRIDEKPPEIGDIIQRNRGGNNYSFSYAENHERYLSHSDIVVEVKLDIVRVIGGNVGDTVSMAADVQEYDLNAAGLLKPGQGIISLLKNRAGLSG